ncbi:Rpn family recombination-promoting nuclease/putative transposase [Alcanivorax quisquiliarum]|uniref:Rpn family recombination-promoting nuclease/putative transposase n=1 Tax=Alcanivorax quisquiliarum TaxID=2933565 RepID=A0ABT0E8Y9_9GAMM|nr:Rpn family recombination-promoting nuclease/putative transposase [Alcanivorax quisquiliarum]MCK0538217.1 Rpn family recombination-promoting nuclease/putative transposase [Alcanivorax quisquiliarum]
MDNHDTSYRLLFAHAEMVRELLKGFVPGDWVRELDLDSLEKMNGSYVSDDLRSRHSDAVWRVRWGPRWVYVYLLLEFQSTVDRFMPVRVLSYIGLLYQDLIKRREPGNSPLLPPVLPIVLYNGKPRWRASVDLADLIQPMPQALHEFQPRQRFLLLDEGRYQAHELPAGRNLVAALFRLEHSATPEALRQVLALLVDWLKTPELADLRRHFVEWLRRRGPSLDPQTYWREINDLQEANTMLEDRIREWKAQFRQEGLQEGLEQGLEQGVEQGVAQGVRTVLHRQLLRRFGSVPEPLAQRLAEATLPQLEAWADLVYEVETIDDIFH